MTGNELRQTLRNGNRVYGTLIVSTSPSWIDIVGQLNLDFVFIDTEHIAVDLQQLSWMCHAYMGKGVVPLVRISSPDPYEACRVLDSGAKGIISPYTETPEEVQQLRGAVKTRPLKGKRLDNYLNGSEELEPELARYIKTLNENHVLIVNIESHPAMENLDEILAVPGLDGVLIGPHDLTCSLGIPEQYDHPQFLEAVEEIIAKAREAGVGAGVHAFYVDGIHQEIAWGETGANLMVHSGDINRFSKIMGREISELRQALGEKVKAKDVSVNI